MIYTVTFSPALDYVIDLDRLEIGSINRTRNEYVLPGGKGINVSIVLANLGRESTVVGFTGGFTGQYIKDELTKRKIKHDFVEVNGLTRINVKIRGKRETAINGQGPIIKDEQIIKLVKKLEKLDKGDVLVISGTVPSSVPSDIYETVLERIKDKGVTVVVDSNKDILKSTLKYKPFLVKPNKQELEEITRKKIKSDADLLMCAKKLINLGAQNVIVSLGGDGALLVNKELEVFSDCPKGKVVNTVGSGDSLVAGFIDEYLKSDNLLAAFYRGIASGSASAFSDKLPTKQEIDKAYRNWRK